MFEFKLGLHLVRVQYLCGGIFQGEVRGALRMPVVGELSSGRLVVASVTLLLRIDDCR